MTQSPPITLTRPIALVGLMGVGKSTIGRRLAKRLQVPFRDTDDEIVKRLGVSIPDIFEMSGEAFFRDQEHKTIMELVEAGPCVLATGGGAFVQPKVQALLKAQTLTVWLDAPVSVLVERVALRPGKRPLLKGQDISATLEKLLEQRLPAYQQADLHIESGRGKHHKVVDAILDAMTLSPSVQ